MSERQEQARERVRELRRQHDQELRDRQEARDLERNRELERIRVHNLPVEMQIFLKNSSTKAVTTLEFNE